jgi:hypothetical protein
MKKAKPTPKKAVAPRRKNQQLTINNEAVIDLFDDAISSMAALRAVFIFLNGQEEEK